MKFILLIFYLSSLNANQAVRTNLITCFTCSGSSCHQPFNLSEAGIFSSLCADGCVMQQIKLNSNVITTIRGCITNEGCETVARGSILYENTCCFHNLCNSFFPTTTTSTTTTLSTTTAFTTENDKNQFSNQDFLINSSNIFIEINLLLTAFLQLIFVQFI